MLDLLIYSSFIAVLIGAFLGLKWSGTRSINRFIAEHTRPIDDRAQKRKWRAADLRDWEYQFAALQIACKKRKDNK